MSDLAYTYVSPVYASPTVPETQIRASFDNRLEVLGARLGPAGWYEIEASCPETQNKKVSVLARCDGVTEQEHEGKKSRRMRFRIAIPGENIKPHTCRLVADRLARKLTKGPLTFQCEKPYRLTRYANRLVMKGTNDPLKLELGKPTQERTYCG